ncbi:MAG TPA: hypothetical protein VKA84_03730, partial [Gemmatimonadaceae bacterium]|nr:hypothetical protein [Gemmatimonadaceae bacterium]
VAALDFLSRDSVLAPPAAAAAIAQRVLDRAGQLAPEDRARLAGVLARLGRAGDARRLLEPLWESVRVEGRRAVLGDSADWWQRLYFRSELRPLARLVAATLAVDPSHRLLGPLTETLVHQGRATPWWNTQDLGAVAGAMTEFDRRQRQAVAGGVMVRGAGGRVLFRRDALGAGGDAAADSSIALAGLLRDGRLTMRLEAPRGRGDGAGVFYFATVYAVPLVPPTRADSRGIVVERWYERAADGRPLGGAVDEGDLVRVRLRVTLPATRQFLVLDDPLPGGLEAVDLSLRTADTLSGARRGFPAGRPGQPRQRPLPYGRTVGGGWMPWQHQEIRDDRVVWSARWLPPGVYEASYVARATTAGTFVRPPAHAEEMYNPAVYGESDGGAFTVRERRP